MTMMFLKIFFREKKNKQTKIGISFKKKNSSVFFNRSYYKRRYITGVLNFTNLYTCILVCFFIVIKYLNSILQMKFSDQSNCTFRNWRDFSLALVSHWERFFKNNI